MEKLKKISVIGLFVLMLTISILGSLPRQNTTAFAEEESSEPTKLDKVFKFSEEPERDFSVSLNYSIQSPSGDVNITMGLEKDEETLKRFQKYVKKEIDSADVGEVLYVYKEYTVEDDSENYSTYKFTKKLPSSHSRITEQHKVLSPPLFQTMAQYLFLGAIPHMLMLLFIMEHIRML